VGRNVRLAGLRRGRPPDRIGVLHTVVVTDHDRGITPAEAMLDLYDYPAATAGLRMKQEVALPAAVQRRAVAESDVNVAEARSGVTSSQNAMVRKAMAKMAEAASSSIERSQVRSLVRTWWRSAAQPVECLFKGSCRRGECNHTPKVVFRGELELY
jgi:hypothetical protein